jgi:hypothetical protein
MFEFITRHASFLDFLISLQHYTVIGKQLFISNDRNRVCWADLGLLQDGACNNLFENLRVNSLKGDLSNATTFNQLFSPAAIIFLVLNREPRACRASLHAESAICIQRYSSNNLRSTLENIYIRRHG